MVHPGNEWVMKTRQMTKGMVAASLAVLAGCEANVASFTPVDAGGCSSPESLNYLNYGSPSCPEQGADVPDGGGVDGSTPRTSPGATPLPDSGIDGSTALKDLSASDARSLCAWLIQVWDTYAGQVVVTPALSDSTSGYVSGPTFSCGVSAAFPQLAIQLLDVDNCVLNLQHSPCDATAQALEACVAAFYAQAGSGISGAASCADVWAACQTYEDSTSCGETIVSEPSCAAASDCPACAAGALPTTADASCPVLLTDAGSD